jgi:hypothetical protein
MKRIPLAIVSLMIASLVGWVSSGPVFAWVYPEHRDISLLAVQHLDPARRAIFDSLWQEARRTHEHRLCEQGADVAQGLKPACIDWAALAAIAGDHSCSSREMSGIVLESKWILTVADIAAKLKVDLAQIDILPPAGQVPGDQSPIVDFQRRMESEIARAARINSLRSADIRLQRADREYATRAQSNNAHFLLARPRTDTSPTEYFELTLRVGSDINAMGVWGWYHLRALQKASRLAKETLAPEERQGLALSMLFDEGFALHFLQDIFSAGHVAGSWGNSAQRKGTHDLYNESGLEVFLWLTDRKSVVVMGDAHMRPEDAERAAVAIRASLEQVLDTVAGSSGPTAMPYTPAAPIEAEAFDVCKHDTLEKQPEGLRAPPQAPEVALEVLKWTPMPGLGPGLGAMPRFRSELGRFVGLAGMIDGRHINSGFTGTEGGGFIGGLDLSVRIGMGLEGVLDDSGDGLIFLAFGLRGDTSSSNRYSGSAIAQQGGNLTAAIPSHVGLSTRVRMPFFLIPGDLFLLSPLYLIAPDRYMQMAVTASNGGLIPWQSGWATPIGRFQFVLGRELGVTFFGLTGNDRLFVPSGAPGDSDRVVSYRSMYFDLPVLEYRPFRAFSSNQSATLMAQLFTGITVPYSANVILPAGAPQPDLSTVWSVGLRVILDWRYYP